MGLNIIKKRMIWTKRLFSLVALVLGLYLFGDFRINDVNVRDYLHEHISAQNIAMAKTELSKAFATLYQMLDAGIKDQSVAKKSPQKEAAPAKQLDQISEFDQQKMKKLLEKHVADKPEAQPKSKKPGQQANDYLN